MERGWCKGYGDDVRDAPTSACFVDCAGQTVELIDGHSREIQQAQIFITVIDASRIGPVGVAFLAL